MFGLTAKPLFKSTTEQRSDVTVPEAASHSHGNFKDRVQAINADPYLCIADDEHRLITVFDDLKYDRADLDMVAGPMRLRALTKLQPLGFVQTSGSVFENKADDVRCILPKFRALGASPFHATRDTSRRPQDYFILTPTQAACQIIDTHPLDRAVQLLEGLVTKHPVNLLRIFDYLEATPAHEAFREAIGHLTRIQREAIAIEPLKTRRALR